MATNLSKRLRAVEAQSVGLADGRPTLLEIWHWKLEEVVAANVEHWRSKTTPQGDYDHFFLYAHRACLRTKEDVGAAPDDVLLEALGLPRVQEWGWLHFIVRELGWFGLIAANWGWPVLPVGEDVQMGPTTEEQRRAQAVAYFLELMHARGFKPLTQIQDFAAQAKAGYRERVGKDIDEPTFIKWLRRHHEWLYFVYVFGAQPNLPAVLSAPKEPAYRAEHRAQFGAEIRAAAERRRRNWNASHADDCRAREIAAGLAAERQAVAEHLQQEDYRRWVAELGETPAEQLFGGLLACYGDGKGATGKDDNVGHIEPLKLCVFLLANPKALDLLRRPENRELGLTVRKYLPWVYIPSEWALGNSV